MSIGVVIFLVFDNANLITSFMVIGLLFALFQIGFFGGADAKLLMLMALLFPNQIISILGNSVLLSSVIPICLLMYNVKNRDFNRYLFTGYKTTEEKIPNKHTRILKKVNDCEVWVTPQIPYMFLITAGFLTAFVVGDLINRVIIWIYVL